MMKNLVLLFLVCAAMAVQAGERRYACTFETAAERQQWTLNSGSQGSQCANRWYIGQAGANEGHYGLFVSNDSLHATYVNTTVGAVVAYTDIQLEKDNYTLSFNWRMLGLRKDTSSAFFDQLYVCWVPTSEGGSTIAINSNKSKLPAWVSTYRLPVSHVGYLAGARSWASCQVLIDSTRFAGTGPYRLAFVWSNSDSTAIAPSAQVDNIEIQPQHLCASPHNLYYTLEEQEIHVYWSGTASRYEVRCYNHESGRNYTREVTDTMAVFDEVPEGRVDIYVRALCGDEHSAMVSTTGLVYYPGTRCINFLDIQHAQTYVGHDFALTTDPVTFEKSLVDFGYESPYSRHTVHYVRGEKDAQTNFGLSTVPDDEIASVRLGNWRTGTECERIEYDLHINAEENPVLVLKYAIVMENPDGHSTYQQPRFTLRILKNGKSVNNHCVEADFTADKVDTTLDQSWHRWTPAGLAATDIVWKEWTTVGVDLSEYDGEDLVVQLTSYDCSQSGHFGYIYFTLSCSDGKFKDMSCGQINPTFYAPAGFLYRWYQKNRPDHIVSRTDTLHVGYNDTLTYACDMMFPKDTTCFFTLYADAMARFPIPEMSYHVTHDCSNTVRFKEKSHLLIHNHVSGEDVHDYKQYCDYTICTFHDGTSTRDASFVKEYPLEGGSFPVIVHAYYVTCDSVDTIYITLPDVRPTSDTIARQICASQTPFIYPSEEDPNRISLSETGLWPYTVANQYGCDSTIMIDLLVITDDYVTQRWNDVLAVRNSQFTDGVHFVAFQWKKDGELLPNETSSVLYVPAGLDTLADYTVVLTSDEGLVVETCPYRPQWIPATDMPVIVEAGQSVMMRGVGDVRFYSPLGQCLSHQVYNNSTVQIPNTQGVCVMTLAPNAQPESNLRLIVR